MPKFTPQLKTGSKRVSLNWTQLNAITNGVSAIDQGSLAIRNRADALRFASEYGFDLDLPTDRSHIAEVHQEAIDFIEAYFLREDQASFISEDVRHPEDVLDLLVLSSNYLNKSNVKQMWACAVLKVMHGIFHIDHDFKLKHFDEIRTQIFESLDQLIISKGSQHLIGDEKIKVPLYYYEKKRNKGRWSILLKLLQKPNYVAADIYDHLGIRLVFETKAECLFALQLLRKKHLISTANIKPFRSRNNLVDLNKAKKIFKRYRSVLNIRKHYPLEVLRKMDEELEAEFVNKGRENNPHSSLDFRTVQVTARKMIHIPNPAYQKIKELLTRFNGGLELPDDLDMELEMERELSFYFDYEIQLLDKKAYLKTLHGPSSHRAYKERQKETARRRVLGPTLIKYLRSKDTEA